MIGLSFAVIGLYLILSILTDWGYIENKSKLWHWTNAARRTMVIGYFCYMQWGFTWYGAIIATDILTVWWIVFDIVLNLRRDLPIFYVGSGTMDLTVKAIAKKINIGEDSLMFLIKLFVFLAIIFVTIYFIKA